MLKCRGLLLSLEHHDGYLSVINFNSFKFFKVSLDVVVTHIAGSRKEANFSALTEEFFNVGNNKLKKTSISRYSGSLLSHYLLLSIIYEFYTTQTKKKETKKNCCFFF